MSESEIFRVLDFDWEISNQEGLSKTLSRLRGKEMKKLHQGKENFRLNKGEELEIEGTSDRDEKITKQDCQDRDILERLIFNAIIVIRCNIKRSIARK